MKKTERKPYIAQYNYCDQKSKRTQMSDHMHLPVNGKVDDNRQNHRRRSKKGSKRMKIRRQERRCQFNFQK